jgi:hypothetical protein
MAETFLTKTQLARARGLDPRNKLLQGIEPAGFLVTASKKIPLFRGDQFLIPRLSAAGSTAGLKMPLSQPEPSTQNETGKS